MFGVVKAIDMLEKEAGGLKADINIVNAKVDSIPTMVECERCGCLLKKGTAIRGESVIEKTLKYRPVGMIWDALEKSWYEEVIRERYYCKVHAPKGKK